MKKKLLVVSCIFVLFLTTVAFTNKNQEKPPSSQVESAVSIDVRSQYPEATKEAGGFVPQYDIPWQEGWLTANQVFEQALPMLGQLQKIGSLAPVSVRLTTFEEVSHGGNYLPAKTPVWHLLFKGDGRIWVPTSGPMVLNPQDSYSHTVVVNTVEIALRTDSGEQIFQGFSSGLETTLPLEELKGIVAEPTDQHGDQLIIKTSDSCTVNVLLPRGMTSEIIDSESGTRTKLTFWENLNLKPGTSVKIHGLTTKNGDFLAYTLKSEKF